MADKKQFIYIVDDEPLQLELLKDHLSSKMTGYEILTFDTGEACIESLPSFPTCHTRIC